MSSNPSCWTRIGVRGDRSCERLAQLVHCHNCPEFAAGAARLRRRAVPEGYREQASAHYAQALGAEAGAQAAVLVFRVGPEWLGLNVALLAELTELRAPRPLPQRRGGALQGLVNVRGELLPCVSLARLLGIAGSGPGGGLPRLLVLRDAQARRLACPVDEVQGLWRHAEAARVAAPTTLAESSLVRARVPGAGGIGISLLNEELLLRSLERSLV